MWYTRFIVMDSKNKKNKSRLTLTVSVLALLLLIILSVVILLTRLAVSLPFTDDSFVINPEFHSVEFGDDEGVWSESRDISIFKVREVDECGNVVVESCDGNKIIAPGMEGDYRFLIKNLGKFAVDSKVVVKCDLTVNGDVYDTCPIEVRLTDYMGEAINGGWNYTSDVSVYTDNLIIGKNSYIYYTFDYRWNFEGNDVLDTILGNLSVNNDVEFKVSIVASATRSADKDALGGIELGKNPIEPGDLNIIPFIVFNVIIFLIIVTLLAYDYYKRKKERSKYRLASKKQNNE